MTGIVRGVCGWFVVSWLLMVPSGTSTGIVRSRCGWWFLWLILCFPVAVWLLSLYLP